MKRSGVADLYLHPGQAPRWLLKRMTAMAGALLEVMVDEHGPNEVLRRLGDPLWFQALSNALGFDWDSSGTTTVLCGVLKSVLRADQHGLLAFGGKGACSRQVPNDIAGLSDQFDVREQQCQDWISASRLTAKVDSAVLQDGFNLYHHMFFLNLETSQWTVVQQGMDPDSHTSRRYHWISEGLTSFVEEPHSGLFSGKQNKPVLNLISKQSRACRSTCVNIAQEQHPNQIRRQFFKIKPPPIYQRTTLMEWSANGISADNCSPKMTSHRVFPKKMNWDAIRQVYEVQPKYFEDLLMVRGVGASTLRGLALLSEMIYGTPPSWEDPVRMTFAFGGKDGVPFPIDRKAYDEAIFFLKDAIDKAKLGKKMKLQAFRQLRKSVPHPLIGKLPLST